MDGNDINFLEDLIQNFIAASINRLSHSGMMTYRYQVMTSEVKHRTNRTRLHQSVVAEYIAFFQSRCIGVVYDEQFGKFDLTFDLNQVVLNSNQARDFATAMEYARSQI